MIWMGVPEMEKRDWDILGHATCGNPTLVANPPSTNDFWLQKCGAGQSCVHHVSVWTSGRMAVLYQEFSPIAWETQSIWSMLQLPTGSPLPAHKRPPAQPSRANTSGNGQVSPRTGDMPWSVLCTTCIGTSPCFDELPPTEAVKLSLGLREDLQETIGFSFYLPLMVCTADFRLNILKLIR